MMKVMTGEELNHKIDKTRKSLRAKTGVQSENKRFSLQKGNMASEGNLFDSFVALTGAKMESAESWLEMANFDLETAVQLFFENGDKPPQLSAGPSLLNSIGNDYG